MGVGHRNCVVGCPNSGKRLNIWANIITVSAAICNYTKHYVSYDIGQQTIFIPMKTE